MLPDIQPGNTKILYFFNCLLDGMHTKALVISLNFVTLRCGILTVTLRARFRARLSYQAGWNV